ncbi:MULTISPECIES: 16S rRNA (uracil(1498)-N(3))-methyltransferase [Jeotgalicoccus]|uniref:RsmE family RNA methyltransferase n=1 Tax=Jeotgalicoccus TaxID=227979 RepID=UPI00047D0EEC|nr:MULTISPECIES: 16S rRNA (uracil(1498)-N(3))-methyltransferase [Jeotgalicoccus]QQD85517.1 16S rRNA (uracil(1498)-N(3))-methyltransferase [Jeotgalicoccus sp. ATCC 8456]
MQRYFIEIEVSIGGVYEMDPTHHHHIRNVMRSNVDDTFTVVDCTNTAYFVQLISIEPLEYKVLEQLTSDVELPVQITVFSPLLKGDKMDTVLQKSTELGASDFVLYKADRSVVKLDQKKEKSRLERFEKIVREAAEQSKRTVIPQVSFDGRLKTIDFSSYDLVLFAYEDYNISGIPITSVLEHSNAKNIAFIFGPEGGFTSKEVELFKNDSNVSLGHRILRAETAPLYALSVIGNYFE